MTNSLGKLVGAKITSYGGLTAGCEANAIATGPDGAAWFTENGSGCSGIGRIDAGGSVTEYAIGISGSIPAGITTGPDGALWFADYGTNAIGRMTTTGTVTEYALSGTTANHPYMIAAGGDGALWFTVNGSSYAIGRIATDGTSQEYGVPPGVYNTGLGASPPARGAPYGSWTSWAIASGGSSIDGCAF